MRAVFANSMVAHVWATGGQSFGRSNNGNFYFEGPALYSYGSHFLVAFRLDDSTAYLNASRYSVSTSQHCGAAWSAARHMARLSFPDLTALRDLLLPLARRERLAGYRRAEVLRYLDKHAGGESTVADESALHLLGLAKIRDGAARWERIKATRARNDARKAGQAARELRDSRLTTARCAAAWSPEDLESGLRRAIENRRHDPAGAVARAALDLHHAHRAAVAAGRKVQARKVWAVLQTVRARIDVERRRHAIRDKRARERDAIRTFRSAARDHAAGTLVPRHYAEWQHVAALLAGTAGPAQWQLPGGLRRGASPALLARLAATAAEIAAEVPRAEARAVEIEDRRRAGSAERAAREAAERQAFDARNRAAWLAGGNVPGRFYDDDGGALLRVMGTGDAAELQTSWGAAVPLAHAVRALPAIAYARATQKPWHRNGSTIQVGHFQFDRIEATGDVRAGCHVIRWPEIARITTALGLDVEHCAKPAAVS